MRCALLLLACLVPGGFGEEQPEPIAPITVAAKFQHGRVIVPAKLNEHGPFSFLIDTACTIPTIHPTIVDELALQQRGFVRIHGIAGVERAPTYPNLSFDFGGAVYKPRRIAAIPSERNESRRRRDGVIGSGFFDRFVVEIDGPKKVLRLHSPTNFVDQGEGEVLSFRFHEEIPVIKASIVYPAKTIEAEFEIDTGCDSGLCLGRPFVEEHNLLDLAKGRADQKFGVGGSTGTHNASIPVVRLGKVEAREVQADLFLEGSPVDAPLAGHIGAGLLSKYRVIYDYSRKRVLIK